MGSEAVGDFAHVVAGKFWVDDRMPKSVSCHLIPILERHARLVPSWCGHIDVFWKDNHEGAGAGMESYYDYRRAALWIYPNFLTRPDRQENTIVHELMHLLTEPWHDSTINLRRFIGEHHPESKVLIEEQLRHAMEQTICDLADALAKYE